MAPKSFGKYEVIRPLGHGGMAAVYEARDPDLERLVAIKVIHAYLALDPNLGERFRREARLVASLRHPHIVQLHDFGVAEDQPYMVMEYLEGGTLKDRLAERRASGTRWDTGEVLRALQDLASALDYAHARGAVHRDIKPGNVLFTAAGDVVLTDFGIAKLLNDLTQLSVAGSIIGTPVYMSPEQAKGGNVDHRSDIYSLAIVIYEMLAGRPPFEGESPTTLLLKQVSEPPPRLTMFRSDVPVELAGVMDRALAKGPDQRYASAGAFALAFGEAIRAEKPMHVGQPAALDAATIIDSQAEQPDAEPRAGLDATRLAPGAGAVTPPPAQRGAAPAKQVKPTNQPKPVRGTTPAAGSADAESAATRLATGRRDQTPSGGFPSVPTPVAEAELVDEMTGAAPAAEPVGGAGPTGRRAGPWGAALRQRPGRRWLVPGAVLSVVVIAAVIAGLMWLRPGVSASEPQSELQLIFTDSSVGSGRTDQVTLIGSGAPAAPEGKQYEAWLIGGGDARRRNLGPVPVNGKSVQFTYNDPQGKNLLADFDAVEITIENAGRSARVIPSTQVAARGSLPPLALMHLKHLLVPGSDPPDGGAYVQGLLTQAQALARLGQQLQASADAGDRNGMTNIAEGMVNLIAGPNGPNFGDANGDGAVNDRSDGRGILAAGNRAGYADAVINHARLAAEQPDATDNIQMHASHVEIAAGNVHDWATQLEDLALKIAHAQDVASVRGQVRDAAALSSRILNGQDTNGNEKVEPIPGEGGAQTVLEHMHLMTSIELSAP